MNLESFFYGFIAGGIIITILFRAIVTKKYFTFTESAYKRFDTDRERIQKLNKKLIRLCYCFVRLRQKYIKLLKDFDELQETSLGLYEVGRTDEAKEISQDLIHDHEHLTVYPVSPQSDDKFEKMFQKKNLSGAGYDLIIDGELRTFID